MKLKLQTGYECNRLAKNYLMDVYEKIIPKIQYQINSDIPKENNELKKIVKKA